MSLFDPEWRGGSFVIVPIAAESDIADRRAEIDYRKQGFSGCQPAPHASVGAGAHDAFGEIKQDQHR